MAERAKYNADDDDEDDVGLAGCSSDDGEFVLDELAELHEAVDVLQQRVDGLERIQAEHMSWLRRWGADMRQQIIDAAKGKKPRARPTRKPTTGGKGAHGNT